MRISKQEIGILFEKVKDEDKLKELLQEIYSHEENIKTFSEVCFPYTVVN